MKEQFLNHILQTRLCSKDDKILLAVSGGLDSMVMLHLFHATGFTIAVAHCNFQLRGTESDGDESLVKQVCEQLNVKCLVKRFQTTAYAEQNGLSIQMAARELRYGWFDEVMHQENYTHLATAHHLNDNIETVLLNFVRGSGIKSIPEKNKDRIRPLLHFTRQGLETYASENGIVWRDDSSNATDDYSRNFIRHHITPLLRKLNPNLEEGFERTIQRLSSAFELAEKQREIIEQHVVSRSANQTIIQKSFASSVEYAAPLLWDLLKKFGFNFEQAEDIIHILHREPGRIFRSPGYELVVDRDALIITPHERLWDDVVIQETEAQSIMGPFVLHLERPAIVEIEPNALIAWLDKGAVKFPLTWRLWKDGDFFYPLGMEHRKKVSDFLIDKKLSVADKNYVTVLESGGNIVWVVGHRIDNRFKIKDPSKPALRLTLGQYFV